MIKPLNFAYERLLWGLPCLLCFALPISTALTNVCVILMIALWAFHKDLRSRVVAYYNHSLTPILGLIFCLYLVGGTLAPQMDYVSERLSDGARLLMIPIFCHYFQAKGVTQKALTWFVAAMLLTLVIGGIKLYAGLPIGEKYVAAAVFKSHIDTAFFMVIALACVLLSDQDEPPKKWLILIALALVFYILFMNVGRIGYIGLALFVAFWGTKKFGTKGALLAIIGILVLGALAYGLSPKFQYRLDLLSHDWDMYQQGRLVESSLGSRVHFYLTSLSLWLQKPLLGWGTGGFGYAYESVTQGNALLTDNPHNEFLRIGVEHGVLGLGLFAWLFARQWRLSLTYPTPANALFHFSFLFFLVGSMLNSWLIDFSQSYFYVIMSAMTCPNFRPLKPGDLVCANLQ